jgi:O-antigen/teichoic acid export membrane protein
MGDNSNFQWHTIIGRCCQFLLIIFSIKILTNTITPYEYGVYGIAMASIAIFSYILIGPLGLTINRNIHQWTSEGYLKKILIKFALYSLFVAALTAAIISFIGNNSLLGYIAIFAYMYSYTIAYTLIPNLNILGKSFEFIALLNLNIFTGIFFGYFLIKILGQKYEYWLIGISLGNLISSFFALRVYIKNFFNKKVSVKNIDYKKYFSFSGYMLINSVFTWIYLMGYRYIAGDELGYMDLGIYLGCAAIAAGIISGYEQVVTSIYLPIFYKNIDKNSDAWLLYSKKIISSCIPVCLFVILNSELISKYILPAEYHKYFLFIQLCAVAETLRVILSTFGYKFQGENKTYQMIIPNIALALVCNLIIFYKIGDYGTGVIPFSMILSSVFILIIYWLRVGPDKIKILKILIKFTLICVMVLLPLLFMIEILAISGVYKDVITLLLVSIATGSIFLYALR